MRKPFGSFPIKPDLPPNGDVHECETRRPMTCFEMAIDHTLYIFFVPKDGEAVGNDFCLYKAVLPTDVPEDKRSYQLITGQGIMNCVHVDDEQEYGEVATIIDAMARGDLAAIGATVVEKQGVAETIPPLEDPPST